MTEAGIPCAFAPTLVPTGVAGTSWAGNLFVTLRVECAACAIFCVVSRDLARGGLPPSPWAQGGSQMQGRSLSLAGRRKVDAVQSRLRNSHLSSTKAKCYTKQQETHLSCEGPLGLGAAKEACLVQFHVLVKRDRLHLWDVFCRGKCPGSLQLEHSELSAELSSART